VKWLILFVGGGLGAVLRFALAGWVEARTASPFPWGTLVVNGAGCLLIGLLASWADVRGALPPGARLFLIAGMLGGFTTFSTFGLETWRLLEQGSWPAALANAGGSLVVGLVAVALGVVVGRELGR